MENATQAQDGQQPQQGQTDPQQGAGEAQPKDYKALYEEAVKESRKWEKRSKENLAQLNDLKDSKGKPDPTIEERIAALKKENGDLRRRRPAPRWSTRSRRRPGSTARSWRP